MNALVRDDGQEFAVEDEADMLHPIFDGVAWQQMAATCHKRARPLTAAERRRAESIPDFDDPHFMAKLHTDSAPLRERASLFIGLWNSFPPAVRTEFLADVSGRAG